VSKPKCSIARQWREDMLGVTKFIKKTKQALCYKLSLEYTKVGRAERLRFGDELVKIYMPRFS
jgi:hypothetical protein